MTASIFLRSAAALILLPLASPAWAAPPPPAAPLELTLTPSSYNGFGVSCFGMKDGAIQLEVVGGTAPYTYAWSNGATTKDITGLAAGYYKVKVEASNGQYGEAEITLGQPLPMKLDVDVYEYQNGYNISCFDCSNGNASVVVLGGAAPFTVNWSDGPTGANRYNLEARDYKILVADANGCNGANATIYLRGPERSDWSMGGNANTAPGPQYIGTPDAKDVVFKSNGQERMRLKGNGDIKLWGADPATGPLYRDADGVLRAGILPDPPPVTSTPCADGLGPVQYWKSTGNAFPYPQCNASLIPRMGNISANPLHLITGNQARMVISTEGKVGIGTVAPLRQLHVEGDLLVRGGADGDILTTHAPGTGPVLWARNAQAAWGLSTSPDGKGHILGNWDAPQPIMTFAGNRVGIVTTAPEATLHVDGDLLVRGAGYNGEIVTSSAAATGPIIWARNYTGALGLSVAPDGKGHIMDDWNNPHPLMTFINGKAGVGENNPEASLHVQGDLIVRGGPTGDIVTSATSTTGPVVWARNNLAAWGLSVDASGKGHILGDWNNPHPIMTFAYNKVGIGTDNMPNDDYGLFVGKGILTEKVKVALQNTSAWSDHVFKPGYALMPLGEVSAFIAKHGHLPGVPSAKQMVEQGLDVAKTDAMLMGKIEELTLHLITMEKRVAELERENSKLKHSNR